MSSSPTFLTSFALCRALEFQSAVAHELFSDIRMTIRDAGWWILSFQSAVAHELFSDPACETKRASCSSLFQSAVAHELFSDVMALYDLVKDLPFVSKRCRA